MPTVNETKWGQEGWRHRETAGPVIEPIRDFTLIIPDHKHPSGKNDYQPSRHPRKDQDKQPLVTPAKPPHSDMEGHIDDYA